MMSTRPRSFRIPGINRTTEMNQPAPTQPAIDDLTSHDRPTKKQRVVMSIICFFVFLAVYVLSVGPMAGLHEVFEFRQFQGALEVIYAPLIALIEADVEPIASLLKWYVGLFR